MARGGAFVAAPNSLLSIHYNPSGLALLDGGFHLSGDLNLVDYTSTYARKCPCVDGDLLMQNYSTKNTESFMDGPQKKHEVFKKYRTFGMAYGFDWNHLTIGLAVYGPRDQEDLALALPARNRRNNRNVTAPCP